jgi:PhzF family phenazine biosynthesis protein
MKKLRVYQLNVFTNIKFKGNPAGVVSNADDLSDNQMQEIARELNNSETAFISRPENINHSFKIRFFTPTIEVPSCGHATLAANYVYAKERKLIAAKMEQETKAGVVKVEVITKKAKPILYMTHPFIKFENILDEETMMGLISALGVVHNDLVSELPVQIVSTGHSKVIIPLRKREVLNGITPDFAKLKMISQNIKCNGFFLFVIDNSEKGILTHCRMFAPAIGINEDPVTGNGNGPLGAYLVKYNLISDNVKMVRFNSKQGEAMTREGVAEVIVFIKNNEPTEVKVGGSVIEVFKTILTIN